MRRLAISAVVILQSLLLATSLSAAASAQPVVLRVDPDLTTTDFAVGHLGLTKQRGRFGQTRGTIVLDTDAHSGSVDFVVDAGSVDTGWSLRDAFLRSENMFDTARFPVVRFNSTQLVFNRDKLIGVVGMLTLRDVTRPVALKVRRMECGPDPTDGREGCGADVGTTIKRSEYGMTYAEALVGDEIDLSFRIKAFKVAPGGEAERP